MREAHAPGKLLYDKGDKGEGCVCSALISRNWTRCCFRNHYAIIGKTKIQCRIGFWNFL